MTFEEKQIVLKNGKTAILRSPCAEDAQGMLDYITKACGETDFLARYPEEWDSDVEKEEAWINSIRSSPNALAIVCCIDGEIAGNCEINFKYGIKMEHRASIAIALTRDYWNLGIGSAMFEELISAAKEKGTEIMELEFIEGNERALHLYEKFGFRVVCEIPNAIKLKDGTYLKQIYMQKYL